MRATMISDFYSSFAGRIGPLRFGTSTPSATASSADGIVLQSVFHWQKVRGASAAASVAAAATPGCRRQ